MTNSQPDEITRVLRLVEDDVRASGNLRDGSYFATHQSRYRQTLARIQGLQPPDGKVLDVGSHFLHLASALSLLGFQSYGMDVSVFSKNEGMRRRAARYGIQNYQVDMFQDGTFLAGMESSFDLVIFTEIMEHITFNPVLFWRRIHQLLKTNGTIYVTTPNALTPWKILATIKNAVTLQGTGLPVHRIFDTMTYGHHWKEYTGREIQSYFQMLSPDFDVAVRYFSLDEQTSSAGRSSLKAVVRQLVNSSARLAPPFRDQIEAVVHLNRKTRWTLVPPEFE